jgi:cytosine/uracil/thiamine/allantoin permease
MRLKAERPLLSEIPSIASICFFSILSALIVFSVALLLQWFIYNDWMHRNGQLRLVGSALASAWTFAFVYHRQVGLREKKVEMLRRFERIKWMNDRIRNSLQAIELVMYASNPNLTNSVKDAVDTIEGVLHEVLVETHADSRTSTNRASKESTSGEILSTN